MKIVFGGIVFFVLVGSLFVGLQVVKMVEANWIPLEPKVPPPFPPTISITSPQDRIYYEKEVLMCFNIEVFLKDDAEFSAWNENAHTIYNRTLQSPQDKAGISFVAYTLDGLETVLRNITAPSIGLGTKDYVGSAVFNYSLTLSDLSEGKHTLMVNASGRQSADDLVTIGVSPDKDPILVGKGTHYSKDVWSSFEIDFIVDATKPTITIVSPQNNTYSQTNIPLNFSVNEPTTQVTYSIDSLANITVIENVTLTDVTSGYHKLIIYANDTAGNIGKSETIFFTVETNTPSIDFTSSPTQQLTLEPTLTTSSTPITIGIQTQEHILMFALILAGVVGVVSVLVLFKKRK